MNSNINAFQYIEPFLNQPLVVVGFVLMMVFSIHKQLLKAGIIPRVDPKQGGRIVEILLRYGFLLGLIITLLGFGLKFYETHLNKGNKTAEINIAINQMVTTLIDNNKLIKNADDWNKLGDLFSDKSIEFYQKSLDLSRDKENMAENYSRLGNAYNRRGNLEEAIEFYKKALSINEDLNNLTGLANNYINLGKIYKKLGEIDNAKQCYIKTLDIINTILGVPKVSKELG